jgi:uncharacterized membrane protein YebE (DUF533 family)
MFDANRLLDQFMGSQRNAAPRDAPGTAHGAGNGGLLGGALAGGLVGLLAGTKRGRKIGKAALGYGGSAVLGGLAYKAWSDWRDGKAAAPGGAVPTDPMAAVQAPPAGSPFLPAPDRRDDLNRSLMRAMIAAAKADGHIDADEQQRIFRAVNEMQLSADEKAFVMDELAGPADIDAVAAGASCPETAAELYLASLFAIDASRDAERAYLGRLAARLALDPGLVKHLHARVPQAQA